MLINMLKKKKLFIFDMDGTLVESLGIWNEADNLFLNNVANVDIGSFKIGEIRDRFISSYTNGNPYIGWVKYLKEKYKLEAPLEELCEYRKRICFELIGTKITLKPYAKEVLTLLKEYGYKVCLASSGAKSSIERILYDIEATSFLGNGIFDYILSSESITKLKPSPEIHANALNHFNIERENAVIIEDSKVGLESAINANIDVIIVKDELNKDIAEVKEDIDYYIDSLKTLYEAMLKITKNKPKIRELS